MGKEKTPAELAKELRDGPPADESAAKGGPESNATTTENAGALLDGRPPLPNLADQFRRDSKRIQEDEEIAAERRRDSERTAVAHDENAPRFVRARGFKGQYLDAFFDDDGYSADPSTAKRKPDGTFSYERARISRATGEAMHEQFPGLEFEFIHD